jgi:hypothetical protein
VRGGGSLHVLVEGDGAAVPREAAGARVTLTLDDGATRVAFVHRDGSHLSGHERGVRFGLGAPRVVRVEVARPDGTLTERALASLGAIQHTFVRNRPGTTHGETAMPAVPSLLARLAAAAALLSVPAAAETLRVPQDHPTIQAAVDAAVDGDTILISAGTYAEEVQVAGKTGLILKAKGKVVLDPAGVQSNGVRLQGAPDTQLIGLRVTGGLTAAIEADDCPGLQLVRCRSEGSFNRGLDVETCDGALLDRCHITDPVGRAIWVHASDAVSVRRCRVERAGEGLRAETGAGLLIERNVLRDVTIGTLRLGVGLGEAVDDSLILRNTIDVASDNGILHFGAGNQFERNVVRDVIGDGFQLGFGDGNSGNTLRRNRVLRATGTGIRGGGALTVLEDNRLVDVGNDGINIQGDGLMATRNRIIRPGADGVVCVSPGATVSHNKVVGPGAIGVLVELGTDGSTIEHNRVTAPGEDGVQVLGNDSTYTGNVVTGAVDDGFQLDGVGNVLTKNRASGSGGFDLQDNAAGANTVDETNHFKTEGP